MNSAVVNGASNVTYFTTTRNSMFVWEKNVQTIFWLLLNNDDKMTANDPSSPSYPTSRVTHTQSESFSAYLRFLFMSKRWLHGESESDMRYSLINGISSERARFVLNHGLSHNQRGWWKLHAEVIKLDDCGELDSFEVRYSVKIIRINSSCNYPQWDEMAHLINAILLPLISSRGFFHLLW